MILSLDDVQWLGKHQPRLAAGLNAPAVVGTLDISAYYDKEARKIVMDRYFPLGCQDVFISDHFGIDIRLKEKDHNGWPKVYEVGRRHQSIAVREGIPSVDLHFYGDGHACLGFDYPWDPPLTLSQFMTSLVEPFFFRLAYVDLYGVAAARADLWPEHSHGKAGIREHKKVVARGIHSFARTRAETCHTTSQANEIGLPE